MAKLKRQRSTKDNKKARGKQNKQNKHGQQNKTKTWNKQPSKNSNKYNKPKGKPKDTPGDQANEKRRPPNNKPGRKGRQPSRQKNNSDSEFEEVTQSLVPTSSTDLFPTSSANKSVGHDSDSDTEVRHTRKMVQAQNRKKKKSGGFQSMGLCHHVFKGVIRQGYKIPTPIQRKTIPLILDGKDVVAMARTGSGKTAAFLLPMFERLKTHYTAGARALILAPTRELALQTLKFTKELGRFTGLKCAVILGGDSMQEQFSAIHENPDIIIATPGRFMHVLVEMELKLSEVEYLVFDEADRLFEMGFQEQLREILQRVPETRQTVLFSATLPKLLVEFAKAGLHDPTLIRLDVDSKLSENLKMAFLQCQSDNKMATLLYLLRNITKPSQQTVIFVATKHHVELLNLVLQEAGFSCSYTYSSLDQTARKINVAKFRCKKTRILIVTDLAARGIDIPLLDNVINFNFPAKPKLFVHRVGRVARAGRAGTAYSLIAPDEVPYVLDLHLFLGRPFKIALAEKSSAGDDDDDGKYGRVPQTVIDEEEERLRVWGKLHDIESQDKVAKNGYTQYLKSRPAPSSESVKRMKQMADIKLSIHPIFGTGTGSLDMTLERAELIETMRHFKPRGTIFEINAQRKTDGFNVMKAKREHHETVIHRNQIKLQKAEQARKELEMCPRLSLGESQEADITEAFSRVVAPKPSYLGPVQEVLKKKRPYIIKDQDNYLDYKPKDFLSEKGLSLGTSFEKEASNATLDITGDDAAVMRRQNNQQKWDRKKKKFVHEMGTDMQKKKMKTESGQWISTSYKTNMYKDWLERNKISEKEDAALSDDESRPSGTGGHHQYRKHNQKFDVLGGAGGKTGNYGNKKMPPAAQKRFTGGKQEIKRKEQILKQRQKKEQLTSFMKSREKKRQQHKPGRKS